MKNCINTSAGVFMLVIIFILHGSPLRAQKNTILNESGVYLTKEDYLNNVISNFVHSDKHNYLEQHLDNVFVCRGDQHMKYKFGELYGYYYNGNKYRAYKKKGLLQTGGYYKVIDEKGLSIYSKRSRSHKTEGVIFYYYSDNPTGPIRIISKKNISREFGNRVPFSLAEIKKLRNKDYVQRTNDTLLINKMYAQSQR